MENNQQFELETTLKYYEVIRNALIARVGFRDNSIMLYLAGVAAILAAFIQNNNPIYLMIIPILSLGITGIVTHHHYVIGTHSLYLAKEIGDSLKKLGVKTLQWDLSTFGPSHPSIRLRYFGDASYILLPSLFAFSLNYKMVFSNALVSLGAFCIIPSAILLINSIKSRERIHEKIMRLRKELQSQ